MEKKTEELESMWITELEVTFVCPDMVDQQCLRFALKFPATRSFGISKCLSTIADITFFNLVFLQTRFILLNALILYLPQFNTDNSSSIHLIKLGRNVG